MSTKYIFITGGVISSLGKGIAAASMGNLIETSGKKITFVKLDPYINIDPGTMSPFQHGEVFVTEDGAETDLDLGHYERFTKIKLTKKNNITSGKVYSTVIAKERQGDYLGATVQVIPHITNQIKHMIKQASKNVDVALIEVGGTVGDIESLPFLEAIRQLIIELGQQRCLSIHLTYVPYIAASGEVKTKPTQHSVKELRSIGIQPDILMCRSIKALTVAEKNKISLFTNVIKENVFSLIDVKNIYEVPSLLFNQKWLERINLLWPDLNLSADLTNWQNIFKANNQTKTQINLGLVGKYSGLTDAYKSILEAVYHASLSLAINVNIIYIDAEEIESNGITVLQSIDAILIPGGFGDRGIEGKILATKYARENNIPYLGICLGLQIAVIEFARNCANLTKANSTEFEPNNQYPVVALISEWLDNSGQIENRDQNSNLGGTMRLGLQSSKLIPDTKTFQVYQNKQISERHRHRYEINENYISRLEDKGMIISARAAQDNLAEMIELKNHPWFIACQFHPEFSSTPVKPHPLFIAFLKASISYNKQKTIKQPVNRAI